MGLENIVLGFEQALHHQNLFFAVLGITLGTIIGVLPGLGGANGVAILLPLTMRMPPTSAIILLTSISWGGVFSPRVMYAVRAPPRRRAAALRATGDLRNPVPDLLELRGAGRGQRGEDRHLDRARLHQIGRASCTERVQIA